MGTQTRDISDCALVVSPVVVSFVDEITYSGRGEGGNNQTRRKLEFVRMGV